MFEPLSSFADIHYGRSPADVFAKEGAFPVYGTGGVYGKASRSLFSGPAVIIPRKGSLSSPHFSEGPFWASDTTYAAIPKRGVDAQWLYYQLCQFNLECLNEATGVPSISRDWLAKSGLFPHDADSQTTIADVLRSLDSQIEATNALIAKQERVRAGLMHDLFTRGIDELGRLRPPCQEAPHLYYQTALGWLPKGWGVSSIDRPGLLIEDGDRGTNYPSLGQLNPDGYCLFLSATNVTTSGFQFDRNQFITKERDSLLRAGKLARGDIVITTRGTVGQLGHYDESVPFEHMRINSGMVIVRNHCPDIDTKYLFRALDEKWFDYELASKGSGSAQPQLPIKDFRQFKFPIPKVREQTTIVERVAQFLGQLSAEKGLLAKLKLQKSGLMQDLLTGKVPVAPLLENVSA